MERIIMPDCRIPQLSEEEILFLEKITADVIEESRVSTLNSELKRFVEYNIRRREVDIFHKLRRFPSAGKTLHAAIFPFD